eukprot:Plantae.Rhodophyta-Purpureofilum_apyrenoidigerum.ctg27624.p1 GENE.Plantae.Rhodophyta-Purpureofilum_apyrenoidigerum.ctg27624~~Plantae.Rhodophyta-Purpureofilum_apyrenoidigerum.ctg27624.p1  ORF type:complete len:250 (+),score=77.99 Plantae.Rhodophyta-Purpureofilum_apyrenoidigerum.ctg27624:216-965(+)
MDTAGRERCLYMAKLAEQAERYNEMVSEMTKIALITGDSTEELSVEERNLLSVAYKNMIGGLRSSWRVINSYEQKSISKGNDKDASVDKSYRERIEVELKDTCEKILSVLDANLIPSAKSAESKVFYQKMKGDYFRYLAEFAKEEARKEYGDKALQSYETAAEIADTELAPTHPIRLGLALNFSVFNYEILNAPANACEIAKRAFQDAVAKLDDASNEDTYKDSTLIMQLLRDNLTLWKADVSSADAEN